MDLGEQRGLWIIARRWGVGKPYGHPVPGQLVEHDHLVGVDAGQPVRGQAPDCFEQSGLGGITQRVQSGPVQPGAGPGVVAELRDALVALVRDALAQGFELGADGAAGLLSLGGHPGIERYLHLDHLRRLVPVTASALAGSAAWSSSAKPSARTSSRGSVRGAPHYGDRRRPLKVDRCAHNWLVLRVTLRRLVARRDRVSVTNLAVRTMNVDLAAASGVHLLLGLGLGSSLRPGACRRLPCGRHFVAVSAVPRHIAAVVVRHLAPLSNLTVELHGKSRPMPRHESGARHFGSRSRTGHAPRADRATEKPIRTPDPEPHLEHSLSAVPSSPS